MEASDVHLRPRGRDDHGPDEAVDVDGRPIRDMPRHRSTTQAFMEVRGWRGGVGHPSDGVLLTTIDDIHLHAEHLTPLPDDDVGVAVVVLHGFAARSSKPAYARLADHLAARANVLTVDMRGHGRSSGASSLGDRETEDVRAAVDWFRDRGNDRVVLVGVSMGATSAILAASRGVPASAVVAISAPAVFEEHPRSSAMQDLKRLWHSPVRRRLLRTIGGVDLVPPEAFAPDRMPIEAIAGLDVPVLVVHGVDDHYFPAQDALDLAAAAPDATLWLEPAGFGHAEDGLSHEMGRRLTRAVDTFARTGRFSP